MQKSYSEKLKDPRWQKKRLETLQRHEWTCQSCGSQDKTLHVHHNEYNSGKEPWEYEDQYLTTLCENCHQEITEILPAVTKRLLTPFKLSLHDSFIWECAIEMATEWEDLHGLIYTLWELKDYQGETMEILSNLFRKICSDARKERVLNNK